MKIGKMIRTLRREKGMTQEALAEQLNLSVSAVSQWEMEKTMPDISLIPFLMDIFDVTADRLLGFQDDQTDKQVEEAIAKAKEYYSRWQREEMLQVMEQLYGQYPTHPEVLSFYAFALHETANDAHPERLDKCIELNKKILDRSLNDKKRFRAIYQLCDCYAEKNDTESALFYAKRLPHAPHFCGPYVIQKLRLLPDEEKREAYQTNAQSYLWLLSESMFEIADPNYTNPYTPYTVEQRVALLEQMIAITKIVYGDNLCDQAYQLYEWYRIIGALWLYGGETEKALSNFEIAYEYALQFAEGYQPGDCYTTSLLFQQVEAQSQRDWKNGKMSGIQDLYHRFTTQERYRFLETNPRFVALKEKLEKKISPKS